MFDPFPKTWDINDIGFFILRVRLVLLFVIAFVIGMLIGYAAHAEQLTISDVRGLMAAAGFNPGTTRRINGSLHQLVSVQVTGKNGRWRVTIEEKEILQSSQK